MDNEEVNELVTGLKAIMETTKVIYDGAIDDGFDEKQAMEFAINFMKITLSRRGNG